MNIGICNTNFEDIEKISVLVSKYMREQKKDFLISIFRTAEAVLQAGSTLDILILDTELESTDGIQLGKKLWEKHSDIKLIYISNQDKKCTRAINEAHAFAYLEKPISSSMLSYQLQIASKCLNGDFLQKHDKKVLTLQVLIDDMPARKMNVYSKDIPISDIYYFEYENRMVKCVSKQGTYYLFKEKLSNVLKQTQDYHFICCHKGYIVNPAYISSIQGQRVFLKTGTTIPLAQKRASQVRLLYKEYISRQENFKKPNKQLV